MGLEMRFMQLATITEHNFKTSRVFQNSVLKILEGLASEVKEQVYGLRCDLASLSVLMMNEQALRTHYAKIEQLFFAATHGRLKASLLQTLTLDDLKMVVENNPGFKDTLYSKIFRSCCTELETYIYTKSTEMVTGCYSTFYSLHHHSIST
jgi:hypothetical protein